LKEALKGNRFICNHVSNILLDNSRNIQNQGFKNLLTATEQEILKEIGTKIASVNTPEVTTQSSVEESNMLKFLRSIKPDDLSPKQALQTLYELKEHASRNKNRNEKPILEKTHLFI
jgi:hypothetical protein